MSCDNCGLVMLAIEYESYCAWRVSDSPNQNKARKFIKIFIAVAAFGVQFLHDLTMENARTVPRSWYLRIWLAKAVLVASFFVVRRLIS